MIAFMSGEGKLTLNIYMPDLAYNFLRGCHLLADEISSLYSFCRNVAS
jgi:fumarate hydratase class II